MKHSKVDASDYLKGLKLKFATRIPKKIIRQKGKTESHENDEKKKNYFFFQFNSKNFLRGQKFRWGFLKGLEGADLRWGVFKGGRI